VGAMTQRSGADRFPSSDSLSSARSSPIIRIADIVVVILWLGKDKSIGIDARSALRWYRTGMGLIQATVDREWVQVVGESPL